MARNPRKWNRFGPALAMAAGLILAAPARAQDDSNQTLEELRDAVQTLKQRVRAQDRRIEELETKQAPASQVSREDVRQIIQDMKAESAKTDAARTAWMENFKIYGDFRLRGSFECFDWPAGDGDDKKNRNRARLRLRVGATKTWLDDQLEVGFRLASGSGDSSYNSNGSDPTSTNQTFDGLFSKKPVWIDLAYAKYAPKDLPGLAIVGGKMKTPWASNEIFLDTDVNPEGFWAEYKAPKLGPVQFFGGAGYFVLRESADGHDATMGVFQAGASVEIAQDVKYTLAANYQFYDDYDASGAKSKGNDDPLALVPEFQVIYLGNTLDFKVCGLPVSLLADWAHNCGADDPTARYEGDDDAYAFGVRVGQNKKKGDWSIKYRYAYVQANALPGMFVDSDFGYGNRKGHVLGGEYNLLDSLSLGLNVFFTEPIFSPTTTSGSHAGEDRTTTVLLDLVWKF